jgi:hypothetical protein
VERGDERQRPGDLATGLGDRLRLRVTVLGPSWTRADCVSNWPKREDRVFSETALVRRVHLGARIERPPLSTKTNRRSNHLKALY